MTKPMLVVLVLFSIAVAGCAQSSSAPAVTGSPANVAGVWTGSAGTGGTFIPVTLTLNQSGTTGVGPLNLRRSR